MATETPARQRSTREGTAGRPAQMRRPRPTAETCVRDALEAIAAAQAENRFKRPLPAVSSAPKRSFVVAGLMALLLVALPGVALGVSRALAPGCEPITYTFRPSPPAHVRTEFRSAIEEIHQRSGLAFEEGDQDSKLLVTWSDRGVTAATSSPVVSDDRTTRILGFGEGHWGSVRGGFELVDAAIEVDATASWPLGFDRGDSLAAVFVHELGHVMGLVHSPEATSFMHHRVSPRPPRWTAQDLEQLAQAGRGSGCSVPQRG